MLNSLPKKIPKVILHIDGDAFFASCEIARRPDLLGKPVVVGEDRGIACAMSPQAKKLGVYRGMPVFKIKKEFPDVVVLSSHFELYEKNHENLAEILKNEIELYVSLGDDNNAIKSK